MDPPAPAREPGEPGVLDGPATAEPFEDYYRRQLATMVRLARVLVNDPDDALDVAQEAFVRVWPKFERIDLGRRDGYVRAAVLNGCRRYLRRRSLATRSLRGVRTHNDLGADHVLDAVRQLPAAQRDVVLLRYYLDCSENEIATTLGIRPGTVKSRLHRALVRLQGTIQ